MRKLLVFLLVLVVGIVGCDSSEEIISDNYNLTIEVYGAGSVEPAEGTHEFDKGATVILEVTPDEVSEFKEWTGNNGDEVVYNDNVYQLLMDSDKEIIAIFEEKKDTDSKKVTSIKELDDKTVEYGTSFENLNIPYKVEVTLEDDSKTDISVAWNENDYNSEQTGEQIITGELIDLPENIANPDNLTAVINVTVQEEDITFYTVKVNYDENKGIVVGYGEYAEGQQVEITATPDEGYKFVEWTGYITDTENIITFDMPRDNVDLTAHFNPKLNIIDVNSDVEDISVDYGTAKIDTINKLVDEIVISDTEDTEYTASLDWDIDDYDSNKAGDYTATGNFNLPEGVEQTEPATNLFVEAIISVKFEEIDRMVLVEAGSKGGITLDSAFYIGKYHVTQAEFEAVMGFNPSYFNDDDHQNLEGNSENRPVERVTWYDAVMYCNELSETEGLEKYYNISDIEYDGDSIEDATVSENVGANGYRLPTAEEHEYAARGGKDGNATTYAGSNNLDEVGWYTSNSDAANSDSSDNKGTMPVGEKEANELGIYDMSGNVWDWTNTPSESYLILRGGSWNNPASSCEVSSSSNGSPSNTFYHIGFRLTRRF